jgi:hypothetical protein
VVPFKTQVNWQTAYSSGADIWNPQFLSELQGYAAFRFMDWNATNFSKISSWSQRRAVTDPGNAITYADAQSPPSNVGLAIEWQIDLCNRANLDCWFTTPFLADDDYHTKQAQLIQLKLKPTLRVYVELSNEVWNGSFSAFNQSIQKGSGYPGSNQWYKATAYTVHRSLQIFKIYENVFGAQVMGKRIIRVVSESGNLDLMAQALTSVYRSDAYNPQRAVKIDMLAIAPYINNGTSGSSETLAHFKQGVDSQVNQEPFPQLQSQRAANNIPLLGCYESGSHHLSSADVWAKNPASYDGLKYMLDRFSAQPGMVLCNYYTLHGKWGASGAWGAYDRVGQSLSEAHKARAIRDWIQAHP